ncbi:MAG: hypothetical protein HW409_383, partial [candidate division NC10 bacterium]|nr:hypothetical protein [candidate division NC10 bacterium]
MKKDLLSIKDLAASEIEALSVLA